jgi:hypothetical protein
MRQTIGRIRDLAVWCQDNNLSLKAIKTKEMIVNYRKRRTEHAPIIIDGAAVEQVESFKFLGVHITNKLTWSKHTKTVVKRARQNLFPLRRLKRFGNGPQILKGLFSSTIESILVGLHHCLVWQRVVRTAQCITLAMLPAIQDHCTRRCQRKNLKIVKDSP